MFSRSGAVRKARSAKERAHLARPDTSKEFFVQSPRLLRGAAADGGNPYSAATLSCVLVSKSLASWRSRNWLAGLPLVRFTMRPRLAAGLA